MTNLSPCYPDSFVQLIPFHEMHGCHDSTMN